MNVYLPNGRLPSAYQEVEYIGSSGTQYINTGYIPNNNTKVELSMGGWTTSVGTYGDLFGARLDWSPNGRGFEIGHNSNTNRPYVMFGKAYGQDALPTFVFQNGDNHIIEMSQSGIYEDGTLKKSLDTATFTSPVNLTFFALNTNGTIDSFSSYKIFYLKIYTSGTLVRDFVPCYRKSDSVIGLYDLVNNQFYTNSGTGTFSKGNDVTMTVLKNAYIGEVYEYSYDFRNKSVSQVQNDGWTFQEGSGTVAFNANGVYLSSTSYNLRMWNVKGPWTNANKITMTMTATVGTGSATFKLSTSDNADANSTAINIDSNGNKQVLAIYGTSYTFSGLSSGTYTQKAVLDLVNKTYTLSCTGKSDNTGSITDAQIAGIKANSKTVGIYIWNGSTGTVIRDIKLLVE